MPGLRKKQFGIEINNAKMPPFYEVLLHTYVRNKKQHNPKQMKTLH